MVLSIDVSAVVADLATSKLYCTLNSYKISAFNSMSLVGTQSISQTERIDVTSNTVLWSRSQLP